ncbi:MAG: guanylate kinase [Deltaproteobacteria bacterium]|nr:guanylate kinase [Deltaproteobacteria bacterium]
MPGQLFIISAPSGTGKSTVVNEIRKRVDKIGYSISHTSRKPRNTERDGTDYYFVEREEFVKMIDSGAFAEWAEVYNDLYGTSFSALNEQTANDSDVILDIDVQGARKIRNNYKNAVLIYLLPPSLEMLETRLRLRGTDDEAIINKRVNKAADEIRNCLWYDYIIVNDDLETAIAEAEAIIISERCKTGRRLPGIKHHFNISFS